MDGGEHHRRGLYVCEPGDSEGAADRGVADPVTGDFDYSATGRAWLRTSRCARPPATRPRTDDDLSRHYPAVRSTHRYPEAPPFGLTLKDVKMPGKRAGRSSSSTQCSVTRTPAPQVTLEPGESGVRTFNNERKSTLTIHQERIVPVTDPAADQKFDLPRPA